MRKLVIAWVITLSFFIGAIAWLQTSFEPGSGVDKTPDSTAIASSRSTTETAGAALPDTDDEDPGPMPGLGENAPAMGAVAEPDNGGQPGSAGKIEQAPPNIAASVPAGDLPGRLGDGPTPGLTADTASPLMLPAPNGTSDLVEEGPYGPIPVTRAGRQPWRVHAREYSDSTNRPRVAIIISGLGLSRRTTEDAVVNLPADVTLAFSPYGQDLKTWTEEARRAGHELLVMVPMEPLDYPVNDPGPHSLLTSLSAADNIDKLHYVMSRFGNYVGLMNDMGSRFTASEESLRPLMSDLQRRGVIFVDARTTGATIIPGVARSYGVPTISNSRYIDNVAAASEIDRYLAELEDLARARGSAVGIGRAYPVTIARVAAWSKTLTERGINLAPITAIVRP